MPLFEIETASHIIITWAEDEAAATEVVRDSYPTGAADPHHAASARHLGDLRSRPWGSPARSIPARSPAIAWPRPPATRSTPSASTCSRPAPTWNARARRSSRTW